MLNIKYAYTGSFDSQAFHNTLMGAANQDEEARLREQVAQQIRLSNLARMRGDSDIAEQHYRSANYLINDLNDFLKRSS